MPMPGLLLRMGFGTRGIQARGHQRTTGMIPYTRLLGAGLIGPDTPFGRKPLYRGWMNIRRGPETARRIWGAPDSMLRSELRSRLWCPLQFGTSTAGRPVGILFCHLLCSY